MPGRYLTDTSVVIALFAGDPAIVNAYRQAREIFLPSIVVGELYYGARRSGRSEATLNRIERFIECNMVVSGDIETGRWYGVVKDQLRRIGRPIPENDIWIAALALQFSLTLVSREDHFSQIADLMVEVW